MLIAIDYDKTYTADPAFFDDMVQIAKHHGHKFICATGRKNKLADDERKPLMEIVYCGDELKSVVAKKLGYKVDIWIDDEPGTIEPTRKLEW